MKLIHRLGFYFTGFVAGIIILIFFLSGKKTSCDYGPEARTLKNIRIKERAFSEETIMFLQQKELDTSIVSKILSDGDVLFSESNTDLDSCKIYNIENKVSEMILKITVENCSNLATIQNIEEIKE